MTIMRDDQDLERLLRATLAGRAATVTAGPRPDEAGPSTPRRRWLAPAVAAATVVALAGGALAIKQVTDDRGPNSAVSTQRPTFSHGPVPTRTPTPTVPPPTGHPARTAALSMFALSDLPGFTLHAAWSASGYRQRAVRISDDPDQPVGCNGCESASDYVTVYDKGRFDAAKKGVTSWTTTTIHGRRAYLGSLAQLSKPGPKVPTVAWEYAANSWALVQGVTPLGAGTSTLRQVAGAVEPTAASPILVPFRMTWAPALPVTEVVDDRSEGYGLTVVLGADSGHGFNVLVQRSQTAAVPPTAKYRTRIGGLIGYYDRTTGVADVHLGKDLVEFAITHGPDGQVLDEADRSEMDRIVAGMRWSNGTGRAPYFSLEQAVP